eukprot:4292861-Pyramimonas_sp.AAC.1
MLRRVRHPAACPGELPLPCMPSRVQARVVAFLAAFQRRCRGPPRTPEELSGSFCGLARKAFQSVSSLLSGFWTLPSSIFSRRSRFLYFTRVTQDSYKADAYRIGFGMFSGRCLLRALKWVCCPI